MDSRDFRHRGLTRRDVIRSMAATGIAASVGSSAHAQAVRPGAVGDRSDQGKPHVLILGAGLAGLCAAYELQRNGFSYTILEAEQQHVGGRVRTKRFGGGLYGELGAMRIPRNHDVTLTYVHEFGLALRPFVNDNRNAYYFARGRRQRQRDETKIRRLYELKPWEAGQSPSDLWNYAVDGHLATLTDEEKTELRSSDVFKTRRLDALDRLSLRRLVEMSGLSQEAIEYLLVTTGNESLQHSSATEILREDLDEVWTHEFYEIVGGTELLPQAFASRLSNGPKMGCEVIRLEQDSTRKRAAAVFRAGDKLEREEADFLLCTIPFPVLARMDVDPPFSGEKRRAIRQVWYESSTKVLAATETRFWEAEDGIYGGGSFTDLGIGSIYYPSDNAADEDPAKSAGPGVLLASYTWGPEARRLGSMPAGARNDLAIQLASKVHPQLARPGMVDSVVSWPWDRHRWAGGAFALYMPGQFADMHRHVVAPEGLIHFAGEHCSRSHSWMQGALESAREAVAAIIARARQEKG